MAATQTKRGYLRGVAGMVITPINADGTDKVDAVSYGIKTSQEIGVENEVVEGETSELRGGDKLLVYAKDDDTVVGVNLTLTDARFDAQALVLIMGGTLIEDTTDPENPQIIGWEMPTIEEQQNKPVFKSEVYVRSFDSHAVLEGFVKYSFPYCKGVVGDVTHSDSEWATPEINIWAQENPSVAGGVYKKEFVTALAQELQ
ncbi:hypothetical protein [Mahella australiensis]|uniref:Phage major tail protein, phi13 family n=1 Tax=Mahella australiensis (strain DSM 15567 / CIP 107919 / 50-1 BON) TaxID=697281 RepID=F3ZVD6_MAHA5|nr:hypothetical protein [Mahella australiensis]AEE95286.1 hypothetical protein Mahau_0063 [Mahella australiensis 50-1 BON]